MPDNLAYDGTISIVVPVHNRYALAIKCLKQLEGEVLVDGNSEVIVVDQHSTDGIDHAARALSGSRVVKSALPNAGELRNFGASFASGQYLHFIDSDVVVRTGFLANLRHAIADHLEELIGQEYELPPQSRWIERTWQRLNESPGSGQRRWLNAGNVGMSRLIFESLGGFDASLSSGEDTELCARANRAGISTFQDVRLSAYHLGNPKTVADFFRKQRWHGRGARIVDLPSFAAIAFLFSLIACTVLMATFQLAITQQLWLLLLPLAVPGAVFAFRLFKSRRLVNPFLALPLIVVFLVARMVALSDRYGPTSTFSRTSP